MARWQFYSFRPEGAAVGTEKIKLMFSDEELEAAIIERDADGNPVIEHEGQRHVMAYHADWSHCAAAGWPMTSNAMGVHPSQVRQAEEHSRRMGVPTHYTPTGEPILTSRSHRRRYAHAIGMYDRNAGYGDPAPRNR